MHILRDIYFLEAWKKYFLMYLVDVWLEVYNCDWIYIKEVGNFMIINNGPSYAGQDNDMGNWISCFRAQSDCHDEVRENVLPHVEHNAFEYLGRWRWREITFSGGMRGFMQKNISLDKAVALVLH